MAENKTVESDTSISAIDAGTVRIGHFTVNRLGFGAMRITGSGVWGEPADREKAQEVLCRAAELDINFFDTADSYGPAVSEQIIHDTLAPYDGLMVATKGGMTRSGPNSWSNDASPRHLREACEASLQRLGIEQICLYQLHSPDPAVPFEQSLQALIDLQREGLIRYIGLSNVTLDQLQTALRMAPIVTVQNHYNYEHRRDSEAIVRFCEANNVVFIPYFPIGGGRSHFNQQAITQVAHKHRATTHQIALAWLLAHSQNILPIPGTSSVEHLEQNVAAASIRLDAEDLALLDRLSD